MTAEARIERLRLTNPAAAELAVACALAARVEPSLLRRLRLLIPHADAAAEADLWFSDLLAGRDVTAITLDPLVADVLRQELRRPERADLLAAAHKETTGAHAKAHWSVRLEERVHYLDVAQPATADQEIDDLLLAALNQLRVEPNPRGVARWLAGAVGRLPRQVSASLTGRASAAAAMLHLDQQAPAAELLDAGESQAWLPWLADALPKVSVPVQLLDGAVVLGADGPNSVMLPDVPDTEPLVVEVRWTSGNRAMSHRARFRIENPVQVETGSSAVTLVTLAGASFDLVADGAGASAGLKFDDLKAALRPCLGREEELAQLRPFLGDSSRSWVRIEGRPQSGTSTLLVAAADEARAAGMAVIEHFLSAETDHKLIHRSFLAQLEAEYPAEFSRLPPAMTGPEAKFAMALDELARLDAFLKRPLMVAIDDLDLDERGDPALVPSRLHENVHYRTTSNSWSEVTTEESLRVVELGHHSDRRVCAAMIERDRAAIDQAFATSPSDHDLAYLANDLPGKLAPILRWITSQPLATVTVDTIPPVLTVRWEAILDRLTTRFSSTQSAILLDILRAAHGRNTWNDCAELNVGVIDLTSVNLWPDFWQECINARLVIDAKPDELVEVIEPAAFEQALIRYEVVGERYLGLRRQTSVDRFARTASRTRLAAAVSHALALNNITDALNLCRDLSVLRRRYAENVAALLADLDEMTTHHPDMATLRTVVEGLAKDGVSPADFVPALHTRLVERDSLDIVTDWTVLPPLRVSQVINEPDLQAATTTVTSPGPALAIAQMTNVPISVPSDPDGIVLVGQSDLSTIDGEVLISGWANAIGAARALDGGYALWTESAVWTDTMFDTIPYDGPIDHAVRLSRAVAIAGTDGSVTALATPSGPSRQLTGHGARVTAIVEFEGNVFAAAEDGTIRNVPAPGEQPLTYAGHRGAVRCLAGQKPAGFVSGGDDGCLLKWVSHNPSHPVARWQASAPITCVATSADTVIFGTADGQVQTWNPNTGASTTLGSHDAPVRGVTVDGTIVVSWADSVRFHNLRQQRLLAAATGFPGGVRDVILGKDSYTVLCGNGLVERRRRPTNRRTDDRARACLEIADGQIYAGLARRLLRIAPDGTTTTVSNKGPFLQATKTGEGIAARQRDSVSFFAPSGVTTGFSATIDLAAGNRAGIFVAATGRAISISTVDSMVPSGMNVSWDRSLPVEHITTNTITSLAVASNGAVIAGQGNGDTSLHSEGRDTVLPGDSSPITAVAEVPHGVMTASASGLITYWTEEGAPVTFQRRRGTTAMATSGAWLITAGEDGYVVLWDTAPLNPVHEINLGAPIVALAAEDELVAARDAHGRLWEFTLDLPTDVLPARHLTVNTTLSPDSHGFVLEFDDQSDDAYELTAIQVSINDQPARLVVRAHWPRLESDGRLTVPFRPHPSQPLQIVCTPVSPDSRSPVLTVVADIASPSVRGYRLMRLLEV